MELESSCINFVLKHQRLPDYSVISKSKHLIFQQLLVHLYINIALSVINHNVQFVYFTLTV